MAVDDNVAASFDGFDGHFSVARHSGLATDFGRNNINITCNMNSRQAIDQLLSTLNPQQKQAAAHGDGPLLIVAGAGTGKTATLVHRVAWQIAQGVNPAKILLLTFTRRSSGEMLRRVDGVLRDLQNAADSGGANQRTAAAVAGSRVWGGTFHAIATRLLRRYGNAIGLPEGFTIHDRADSEDLINVVRSELGLAKTDRRFPMKGTCMGIYSRCINSRQKLLPVLKTIFPWCEEWHDELKQLFNAYVDRKEASGVLDYDDLLLFFNALLADPEAGEAIRRQFDRVLVDEYQDTNSLQAEILFGLCPDGKGLTVVGDDAQSIYSFRAATVRNILDLPKRFPDTTLVTLEQNYRSTQPILEATNCVIEQARERFTKNLWTTRVQGRRPLLVTCEDEDDQTEFVIQRILEHRESGIELQRQAVLFRASHHSMVLEAELTRRNIPFHKYGGLKFIETAHVKDLMALLRLAENPRDVVSAMRLLLLLPGVGPAKAKTLVGMLGDSAGNFEAWKTWKPPEASKSYWPALVELLGSLADSRKPLPEQVHQARVFYKPLLEEHYDNAAPRARDLEQIEHIATRYGSRGSMLSEITLDPPNSTQDLAGQAELDDDFLILSTIHSAKGLEWDCVHVIHAADGNIPSDMATGDAEQVEEERRLFYVALTRAKTWLYVCCPLRYYHSHRPGNSDSHGYAQLTRFLPNGILDKFERQTSDGQAVDGALDAHSPHGGPRRPKLKTDLTSKDIRRSTKDIW